jgi:hypothetical protein
MARLLMLAFVLILAGCQTTPVKLRHADGRVVTCGPYPATGIPASAGAMRERGCIEDFQRQGFERVAE